ncbi:hypothetical protein INS49_009692 [Diaporthe citri]|uniref:uncharacterized protein n=1 Tax=Diaporthe citri TaxID=83186 RepID=UPI001C812694|nr:uncharacterized protein INS49_009692 [Diaporthe citri]KAG6361465.1 hypothetical protein INS49_009692 [Diaporthe citri]
MSRTITQVALSPPFRHLLLSRNPRLLAPRSPNIELPASLATGYRPCVRASIVSGSQPNLAMTAKHGLKRSESTSITSSTVSQLTSTPTVVGFPSIQQPDCEMARLPKVPRITNLLEKAFPSLDYSLEKLKSRVTQPGAATKESKKQPTTLPHETSEEPRGGGVYCIGHRANNKDDSKKGRQDNPRRVSGVVVLMGAFTLPFHLGRIDFVNEPAASLGSVVTVLSVALVAAAILICLMLASVDVVRLMAVVFIHIGLFALWAAPAIGPLTVLATLASYLGFLWR